MGLEELCGVTLIVYRPALPSLSPAAQGSMWFDSEPIEGEMLRTEFQYPLEIHGPVSREFGREPEDQVQREIVNTDLPNPFYRERYLSVGMGSMHPGKNPRIKALNAE
jgi:hypothetical protein